MSTSTALLERLRAARLHHHRSAPDVDALVGASIGLHSTDYASPYLSAWARVADVDPARLYARLNTGDGLVRINAMRNTVHVVRVADLAVISAATGPTSGAVGRRSPGLKALSDAAIDAGVEALCAVLADGPRGTNELKAALPTHAADLRYWLLYAMGTGAVIRADAAHARSNRTRYALATQWVPGFRPGQVPADDARRALLLRAVHAFGPLTVEDLAWWLPAPKGEVTRALAAGPELARLEVDGRTYWYPAALADADAQARKAHGAWILPYEDYLLKGYYDRAWCLAPGLREVVFPFSVAHWHPPDGASPGPGPHKGANVSGEARPSIWWGG
ncbi:MAG: crosslink repair DNA glycosylase YcaQ family protein, partial [Myxococcota bacterium]